LPGAIVMMLIAMMTSSLVTNNEWQHGSSECKS
jgi:hypothetical protein